MLSGCDIVLISSIEWDFNWQGHQELATRLARAGNRVLYVENMGVRSPGLRDARRVAQRLSHWAGSLLDGGVRQVSPNLHVCSPLILPPFGSGARRHLNRRLLLPLIRRAARSLGLEPEIIWTFLPTDTAAALVRMLSGPRSVVVYYCIADFAELTPRPQDILESERSIIDMSDVIFAQGARLAERCSRGGKKVEVCPFGVNFDLFTRSDGSRDVTSMSDPDARVKRSSAAELMSALPRPVIGYVGGIHKAFDVQMIASMARAKPDWSWVLVGPQQTPAREMRRMPNVYLTGPKPHEELPDYISRFDVGIVPYVMNGYTETVIPTKINEYLAMGKPVVSTNLPEVASFNDGHRMIITCPNRPEEFIASIERALLSVGGADSTRRRAVAAANDWGRRFERMCELVKLELQFKNLHARVLSDPPTL
jgi:glycosyltransferase involved in cell wall biosynthesis